MSLCFIRRRRDIISYFDDVESELNFAMLTSNDRSIADMPSSASIFGFIDLASCETRH